MRSGLRPKIASVVSTTLIVVASGCAQPDTGTPARTDAAPDSPQGDVAPPAAGPGLSVGDRVGDATLLTASGAPVALSSLYAQRPVVVTFYRGGWCPYCNRALTEWEGRRGELAALGVDFVAITPERPDLTTQTAEHNSTEFLILSDARFQAADVFRVRFTLDQETQARYKGYGVDLASANAAGVWDLPAPGTFLIDTSGTVRYAWAEWDYRRRADPDDVIAAARAMAR